MKAKFEITNWLSENREEIISKFNLLTAEKFYSGISLKNFMVKILNGMLRNRVASEKTATKAVKEHRKRILIVEDNLDIRSYIHSILESDYIIDEAENGIVGLEMIALHDFDLIISDIMMPEMDGIEMCKQLKSSIETAVVVPRTAIVLNTSTFGFSTPVP